MPMHMPMHVCASEPDLKRGPGPGGHGYGLRVVPCVGLGHDWPTHGSHPHPHPHAYPLPYPHAYLPYPHAYAQHVQQLQAPQGVGAGELQGQLGVVGVSSGLMRGGSGSGGGAGGVGGGWAPGDAVEVQPGSPSVRHVGRFHVSVLGLQLLRDLHVCQVQVFLEKCTCHVGCRLTQCVGMHK